MSISRRNFIASTGIGLLAFTLAGQRIWLTPAQAMARNIPFQILNEEEVELLDALAEIILPGAKKEGIAHFIDQQLSVPANESLFTLRYLGVLPPFAGFYKKALSAVDQVSKTRYQKNFATLNTKQANAFVKTMGSSNPDGWQGPPAPLFYFTLHSDVMDVVYGTQEGFKKLDIPYLAHIIPETPW
ncbi:MAG: gluconate 2-dehydrogenase subunit 3 family protein [Gammaproteobacteria bacterium]